MGMRYEGNQLSLNHLSFVNALLFNIHIIVIISEVWTITYVSRGKIAGVVLVVAQ